MQADCMGKDATIDDVLETLPDPEEYVRTVLANLATCRRAHGNASVRIGITLQGRIPSHKVVYTTDDGSEQLFGAFDEDRTFADVAGDERNWSTASMNFKEVQWLLGRIRSFDRRKTPRG